MLNIVAQATTKAALLTALHALTPVSAHRRLIYATSILTIAWAVTAVFIVAFQCPGPQRWNVDNGNCTNMVRSLKIPESTKQNTQTDGSPPARRPNIYRHGQHLDGHRPGDHPLGGCPQAESSLVKTSRRHGGLLCSYTVSIFRPVTFYPCHLLEPNENRHSPSL